MLKKLKETYQPYMTRPMIYMTFTRFILALFFALLADFFLSTNAGRSLKSTAFAVCTGVFLISALLAWLRLDGVKLPQIMMLRVNPSKKPSRMYGDMIDYIDERPGVGFDDLDDEEKDFCILLADIFCSVVFIIIVICV